VTAVTKAHLIYTFPQWKSVKVRRTTLAIPEAKARQDDGVGK